MPYHRHPPRSERRESSRLTSPAEVLDEIGALVAEEEAAGRL